MNSIERLSNRNPIGDQHTAINLYSGIINQYGQLIGEYSRLDDELWFSKPEEDEDDHDALARREEGLVFNFASSYEYPIDDAQLSKSINNHVCDGGTTSVKETSSSLNDPSFDQSQTSSPVYVPRRRRSHCNVRKKANYNAEVERGSRLEGTPKHSRTKLVRMRKVSDLLLSGSRDNQANKTSNLESHRWEGFEELWSREEQNLNTESISKRKKQNVAVKKCTHCESTETPQWREGPLGRKTLCNACGVRYRMGMLSSYYRPLQSPTFDPSLHSNFKGSDPLAREKNPEPKPVPERNKSKLVVKKCMHCELTGPMGHATLCDSCGVQYERGRPFSKYHPLDSDSEESRSWEREKDHNPKPKPKKKPKAKVKKCMHCETEKIPQLREGSMGHATLCSSCSVQHKRSRLFSKDHPLDSNPRESRYWEREEDPNPKPTRKKKPSKSDGKKCMHCETTKTPQWREGPMGLATLCNACGVQYRKRRLFPEYRPLNSPTFNPALHYCMPKKVLQMRMRKDSQISTVSEDSE